MLNGGSRRKYPVFKYLDAYGGSIDLGPANRPAPTRISV